MNKEIFLCGAIISTVLSFWFPYFIALALFFFTLYFIPREFAKKETSKKKVELVEMIEKSIVIMENIKDQFRVLLDTQDGFDSGELKFNKIKKKKRSDEYIDNIIKYYHDELPLILNQIKVHLRVLFGENDTIYDKYKNYEDIIDDIEYYSSNKTMVKNYFIEYSKEEMKDNFESIKDKINKASDISQELIDEIFKTRTSIFDNFR